MPVALRSEEREMSFLMVSAKTQSGGAESASRRAESRPPPPIRKQFPETWIWANLIRFYLSMLFYFAVCKSPAPLLFTPSYSDLLASRYVNP
jgi:hypothetical protein